MKTTPNKWIIFQNHKKYKTNLCMIKLKTLIKDNQIKSKLRILLNPRNNRKLMARLKPK